MQEPSPAAVHAMHPQAGLFAIHTELLTVSVMQPGGQCNMTPSLLADDPNAYMLKMCSRGYYGPLCSLCLLHNAPPGEDRYGRTGSLNCQKCRCALALSHCQLPRLASRSFCWVCLHCAVRIHVFYSALPQWQTLLLSLFMRPQPLLCTSKCMSQMVATCINKVCCCVMQVQHCLWLFCDCLSCLQEKHHYSNC